MLVSASHRFTATVTQVRTAHGNSFAVSFRDSRPDASPAESILGFSYNLPLDCTLDSPWNEDQVAVLCQQVLDSCESISHILRELVIPARHLVDARKKLNSAFAIINKQSEPVVKPVSISQLLDNVTAYFAGDTTK